ncbi:MAG: ABC transporter ATP-binding protein [Flavobacteriaceae bacterium]|jgi:subfamily B ATP-binding cassette protein MsbA|nr:antibiotic ABC transporter ATP-binding protein [Flavobacteriaceae bacterium]MDC0957830.1 ABC transporter ATP-binding protein [Flavobacteriaceae bacterium]MDC3268936.1 ABC transporter ATP-binding protein/permease [Flavobacteriaceae bacterium]MDG1380014.1 ABC transporter ATP-binding protein [Flavobacteriaceae bacterium]MDG2349167.1 ABC transporter ATP-binding protein [Flavobacteriaceae bacterium]|tara:strand:- start:10368 stop:12134 length:1767 start_codon:yes stop_codon:yes gene_type:complete
MAKVSKEVFDVGLFKRLLTFIKPYNHIFGITLLAVFGLAIFGAIRPKVLQLAIDDNIAAKLDVGFLNHMLVYGGLLLLEVISNLLFIYFASWLGQSVVRDIRVKLFEHILKFKMKYYDNSSVGLLITRAVTDMERIADIFGQGLFMIFSDLLKMFLVACVMTYMNWKLSIIVFFTLPVILFATKIFQKYMKKAFEEVRTEVSNLNSFVQERVTGMKILQLFTREDIEYTNFKKINNRHKKGWLKTVWYNSIFFPIAELLSSITLAMIVWFGGLNVVNQQLTTLGDLTAFIMFIPMMFRPLNQIANKFNTLQMGMIAADRVFKVLDTSSNINDSGALVASNLKGEIAFKKVHFSYVEEEEVLKGISFTVKPGETVAIVGATGAGKSTIINLLNRFYTIDTGDIYIDNVRINDFTLNSLRKQIAVVLQDVFTFADTILNNITLKNSDISEEDVIVAAKQIGIHDFIMELPNGYHYNVKERGVMLSSGQRQLISFLRAYVANPSILILDEATSSVDAYSEQLIQEATDKITKGRTSIVIAHRLATIKKANKIIVMDSGRIVEQGTHLELLKKENGYYRNLYEVQFLQEEVV